MPLNIALLTTHCLSDATPKDLTFITTPVKNPNGWDLNLAAVWKRRGGGHLHNKLGRVGPRAAKNPFIA